MSLSTITPDNIVKSTLPPFEYPNVSFSKYLFDSLNAKDQNALALIDPNNNGRLTFGELQSQCQKFALGLLQLNISPQDLILLYSDNSLQLVIALFASIYLGVTVSPVKPANGAFELTQQIIDSSGTVLVIGSSQIEVLLQICNNKDYVKALNAIKTIVVLDVGDCLEELMRVCEFTDGKPRQIVTFDQTIELSSGTLKAIPHFEVTNLATDRLLIAYTSGTTGKPKGAIHSHRSFLATLINTKPAGDVTTKCALIWNPIGHVSGCEYIPLSLINGMSVVLFANTRLDEMLDAVQRFRVNHLYISANHANALASEPFNKLYDLSSLEVLKYGGSRIAASLLLTIREKYHVGMHNYYGATEFYGHVDIREYDHFEPGNLGTVLPNVQMKIVDLKNPGISLLPFENGEICFCGAPCFVGYLNNDEGTRDAIDSDGWYHSGDVGFYDREGCLFISDRLKEMIKFRLWSVIPAEIEDFLYSHTAVESVCVVGVAHSTDGQLVRAYVQLVKGKTVTEQDLIDYVKDNMGFHKRLRGGVQFVEKIPRTVIGKIDRQYFKRLVEQELITESVD